jgi:hypothetical protein
MIAACRKCYINIENTETVTHPSNETNSASIKVWKEAIYLTISINCNKIFVTYHPKF